MFRRELQDRFVIRIPDPMSTSPKPVNELKKKKLKLKVLEIFNDFFILFCFNLVFKNLIIKYL